jgi:uncharacterized protein (TIGR02679 family)
MNDSTQARLQRLLGGDRLASLRKRLRQRFERARLDATVESIRLGKLSAEEHAALASLLGRQPRYSSSLRIDIRFIDAALQRSAIATSLRDALERLDGPIVHLAAERVSQQMLWSDVVGNCSHHDLAALLGRPAGIGLLKRLAKQEPSTAAQLCSRAEAVLKALPANGITRSQMAANILGDAHALDDGQSTATLVLAVRRGAAQPPRDEHVDDPAVRADENDPLRGSNTERSRDTWAKAGVLVNELARPALFLNLPTRGAKSHSQRPGEPAYASLRSLLRAPPLWDVEKRRVYVCENPNLLAIAADRVGPDCAPLVCTDGMPAAAQRCLLSQLAQARARLCYHGDFDWPGVRIGNHVMREHGAQSWRFGAADYVAAVRTAPSAGQILLGKAVDASWDEALTAAMQQHRICIAEEALAASLLQDLGDR